MNFRVQLVKSASKELAILPTKVQEQIAERLKSLADNPCPNGAQRLKGNDGFRLRSGDYRILYGVDHSEKLITVYGIGNRKDVYR